MYYAGDEEVADVDHGAYVASCEFDFIVLDLGPKEMKLILGKCLVIFASMWVFFHCFWFQWRENGEVL